MSGQQHGGTAPPMIDVSGAIQRHVNASQSRATPAVGVDEPDAGDVTTAAWLAGFCPRQAYVRAVGGADTSEYGGHGFRSEYDGHRFTSEYDGHRLTNDLIRDAVVEAVADVGSMEPGRHFRTSAPWGGLRADVPLYDTANDVVYLVRPRANWYEFDPPVERHMRELEAMKVAAEAQGGQVVYVSKKDASVRTVPPHNTATQDVERWKGVVRVLSAVARAVIKTPDPTHADDVPVDPCGCYFCRNEALAFDDA